MTSQAVAGRSYALLADGATVEIRPAGPDDIGAVTRFHEAMSAPAAAPPGEEATQ